MNYIEKNFEYKESVNLCDKEINEINTLLSELKSMDSVESVLLMPFKICEENYKSLDSCNISITIFLDYLRGYDKRINDVIDNTIKELLDSKDIVDIFVYDIEQLNQTTFSFTQIALELALVSSYILYDRNNICEELQKELSLTTKAIDNKFQSTVKIDNIDKINIETLSRQLKN